MKHRSPIEFYREQVLPLLTAELVYGGVRFQSRGSRNWRGPCPLHGGNNPLAFSVNPVTMRWHCFTGCARGGDLLAFLNGGESPKGRQFVESVQRAAELVGLTLPCASQPALMGGQGGEQRKAQPQRFRDGLEGLLETFQGLLRGSLGESYLSSRGVTLEVARRMGVGYAPPGQWPHGGRDWKSGRLVFPHTSPEGKLLNLYGRAVGSSEEVPREIRHAHLPGGRGYFGGTHLLRGEGPVWVCEGVFDALSLTMAGCGRVVAIFGVGGWRWDWAREVERIVFAFDADSAGQQTLRRLAIEGATRGKSIGMLDTAALGGHKDLNEAWCAKTLS